MSHADPARSARLVAIDVLRGLAMVVMVLDHARDLWSRLGNPEDVASASAALFLTRWVTHFCAPAFVLLAGVSAWLHGRTLTRGALTRWELSRFLLVRGLVLIALELTVVSFGWMHATRVVIWQVIAAIGVAMVALAAFVWAPRAVTALAGAALVAGQDLYGALAEHVSGRGVDVYRLLHGGLASPRFGVIVVDDVVVVPIYPVLPWIGVMLLGFAIGPWLADGGALRRARLFAAGAVTTAAFVAVRLLDGFGNARGFAAQAEDGPAWMALLACQKYPPSLAYLLMTLGPLLLLLAALDRTDGRPLAWLRTFGRAPLFFYVAHIYLLHGGARLFFWLRDGEPVSLMQAEFAPLRAFGLPFEPMPDGFEPLGLVGVYVVTAIAVAALYWPCRRVALFKRRTNARWASYL